MTWYAFKGYDGGQAIDLAGAQEKEATALGFHGYATAAEARAHPNSVNALTATFVNGFISDYKFAVSAQEQPGGKNANILNPASDVAGLGSAAASDIPGVAQIGDFFSALGDESTWVRVGEIVAGFLLIYIGLRAATQPGGADKATKSIFSIPKTTKKVASKVTPTGRAVSTVARHEKRVKAAKTRRAATNIRAKKKEFGRKEVYS
jgi:hypothetical protein